MKELTISDILEIKKKLDEAQVPQQGRTVKMTTTTLKKLKKELGRGKATPYSIFGLQIIVEDT